MDPSQLTPEHAQAYMVQSQQEANQQIMQGMMTNMMTACFQKCVGTSVSISFKQIFPKRVICLRFLI